MKVNLLAISDKDTVYLNGKTVVFMKENGSMESNMVKEPSSK